MDKPFDEILALMNRIIGKGHKCYVKWTCPGCGDRCISNVPNEISSKGYTHEEREGGQVCGTTYVGKEFGLLAEGDLTLLDDVLERLQGR